jgi:hypothetical protein
MKISELYVRIMSLFNGPSSWSAKGDATEKLIVGLVSSCPACGEQSLVGHRYGLLATMVAENNPQEIEELLKLFQDHNWDKLAQLNEFDGNKNAIEVFALLCKKGTGFALAIRDSVDIHEASWLLGKTVFGVTETARVRPLLRNEKEIHGSK